MLLKIVKQRFSDIIALWALSVFGYIFGTILFVILMGIDTESTTLEIATIMETIVAIVFLVLIGIFQFPSQFNMAVGMGASRKAFVPCYYVVNIFIASVQYGIIVVSHYIESAQIQWMYPMQEKEAGIEQFLFLDSVIPVILLLAAIQLVAGCCVLKFGKKAYWIIWAAWMVLCIVPGKLGDIVEKNPEGTLAEVIHTIGVFFQSISAFGLNLLLLVMTAVCLVFSWLLARRQQVTNA